MISNAMQDAVAAIIASDQALAVLVGEHCDGSSNDDVLTDVLDAFGLGVRAQRSGRGLSSASPATALR